MTAAAAAAVELNALSRGLVGERKESINKWQSVAINNTMAVGMAIAIRLKNGDTPRT